jgi:hypothetical protein
MHSICRCRPLIATQVPELTQLHINSLYYSSVPTSACVVWEYCSLQNTKAHSSTSQSSNLIFICLPSLLARGLNPDPGRLQHEGRLNPVSLTVQHFPLGTACDVMTGRWLLNVAIF